VRFRLSLNGLFCAKQHVGRSTIGSAPNRTWGDNQDAETHGFAVPIMFCTVRLCVIDSIYGIVRMLSISCPA